MEQKIEINLQVFLPDNYWIVPHMEPPICAGDFYYDGVSCKEDIRGISFGVGRSSTGFINLLANFASTPNTLLTDPHYPTGRIQPSNGILI